MRQVVDFRSSNGDTGYPESDAILPVADGESANQAVLRRPTENTRLRTELMRTLLREHACLVDANTRLYSAIPGNPVTFDGVYPGQSGTFSIGTDLVVVSMGSPGRSTMYPFVGSSKAALSVGTPASNEVVFTSVKKQWEGSSFPAADANAIAVEIVAGPSVTVTLKGPNLDHIYITIVSGTTTCNDVISAVNGSAANTLVLASLGAGSTGTNAAALWGAAQWGGDYTQRFLKGGVAGVIHTIGSTVLSTFFAAATANRIQEGDMIGIWYDKNVDTTGTGGRLQSTYENGNYALTAGQLFNSRREPEKVPNCIPICKCINAYTLLFADGSFIQMGYPAPLGHDSLQISMAYDGMAALGAYCYDGVNEGIKRVTTGTHPHNPAMTIREAFENTDEQVYWLRNHTAAFVSVTDGTTSTGGQYNGPSAFYDAVNALKNVGGKIFVRPGLAYTFPSAVVVTKPLHIVGDGSLITISAGGYALDFTTSAVGTTICGLYFQGGTIRFNSLDITLDNCWLNNTAIREEGERTLLHNCSLSHSSASALVLVSTAKLFKADTCKISGSTSPVVMYSVMDGIATFDNCAFYSGITCTLLQAGNTSKGLILNNCRFVGRPYSTSGWTAYIEGSGHHITNCTFTSAINGAGILSSLLWVYGNNISIKGLTVDWNGGIICGFGENDNPLRFQGWGIEIDHLNMYNFYWGYGANTPGTEYPFVCLQGDDGSDFKNGVVTLQHSYIGGFEVAAGVAIGDAVTGILVGANKYIGWPGANGWFVLDDLTIDGIGKSGGATASNAHMVKNLPSNTHIVNCHFCEGAWRGMIYENAAVSGLFICDNEIRFSGEGTYNNYALIRLTGLSTDANIQLCRNRIFHGYLQDGFAIDFAGAERGVITDNIIKKTSGAAWVGVSLQLANITKVVTRNNNCAEGISSVGGYTSCLPAAAGNLSVENIVI